MLAFENEFETQDELIVYFGEKTPQIEQRLEKRVNLQFMVEVRSQLAFFRDKFLFLNQLGPDNFFIRILQAIILFLNGSGAQAPDTDPSCTYLVDYFNVFCQLLPAHVLRAVVCQ